MPILASRGEEGVPILASQGKAGVPILARPWRPKCQWQGVTLRSGECLARLTIAHSPAPEQWQWAKVLSPNGWGRFHQSADGVPVNPTPKGAGRRPAPYRCGGLRGAIAPRGAVGLTGGAPSALSSGQPQPFFHLVANRIRWSPDPDRVKDRSGGHHGHVANVSTTVNKCKHM